MGLKGMDSSYYNEYFHLLESLSTVKSVVLVCDLVNAEELLTDIFRDFFGMVRRDLPKKIEIFMADILVALVDECHTLPSEVLEILMTQFMEENAVNTSCFMFQSRTYEPASEWTSLRSVLPYKYATPLRTNSNDTYASTLPTSLSRTLRMKRWMKLGQLTTLLSGLIVPVQLSCTASFHSSRRSSAWRISI
jgi:hypothetical protein